MQTHNLNSCRRCWLRSTPRAVTRAHGRVTRLRVVSENCLIVNTNSGAHAFIGLHLAHALLKKNHKVTILNNGDQVNQMEENILRCTTCPPSPVSMLSSALADPSCLDAGKGIQEGSIQSVWQLGVPRSGCAVG